MMAGDLPYPGLRPFQRDESHIFFGRKKQTDELLDRLDARRFVMVTGPSGCGKSSLLKAGLIAGLETGLMLKAGARWRVADIRPGNHPLQRLAKALVESEALGPERAGDPNAEASLYATLKRGPLGLVEVLRQTPLPERTNLFVLVDQFEELFRYRDGPSATPGTALRKVRPSDEADAFVALLLATVAEREVPVFIAITMRSDYLGDCAVFSGLPEAINDSQYLTPRLSRNHCEEAIVGPARYYAGDIEPALVNRILNDMSSDPDQLPLMQHVLMRMWTLHSPESGKVGGTKLLTLRDYEAVGGLQQALSNHADDAFLELDAQGRRVAEFLFKGLTEGERDRRRAATVENVAAVAAVSCEDVKKVADVFRRPDRCFLAPPAGEELYPNTTLDISHESLIRQWRRLSEWVKTETYSAWLYRRLREQADLWNRKEGALWKTPDLETALTWKHATNPTRSWAERYGGGYDLAMTFLKESEAEKGREEDAKLRATRTARELRLTRLAVALAIICAVALFAAFGSIRSKRRADRRTLADGDFRQAQSSLGDEAARALPYLADALRADPNDDQARALLLSVLMRRSWPLPVAALPVQGGVRSLDLSLSQKRLLTAYFDGKAQVWSLKDGRFVEKIGEPLRQRGSIVSAQFSPDSAGKLVVTASLDSTAQVWDAETGQRNGPELRHGGAVYFAAFSPSSKWVVTASAEGAARLWNATTGQPAGGRKLPQEAEVQFAAFSPDGRQVLTAGGQTAQVWDARTGRRIGVSIRTWAKLIAAAFTPRQGQFLASLEDSYVSIGDTAHVDMSRLVQREANLVAASFSRDGRWVVTISADSTARVWDASRTNRASPLVEPLRPGYSISSATISSDGRRVWTALPDDSAVWTWDLTPGRALAGILPYHGRVDRATFSRNGRLILTVSPDSTVRVWDIGLGLKATLHHRGTVYSAAFSPDGHWIVTASGDSTARVWDAETGRPRRNLVLHQTAAVTHAEFSPDGQWLVTATKDGIVKAWDAQTGEPRDSVHGIGAVTTVAFSPDSRQVVVTWDNGTLKVWNATTGRKWTDSVLLGGPPITTAAFTADERQVVAIGQFGARVWDANTGVPSSDSMPDGRAVALSPDGRRVVVTSENSGAQVWDIVSRGPIMRVERRLVSSAAFDREGTRMVTVGDEGSLIWDLVTGQPLGLPLPHSGQVYQATFSPDGQHLMTVDLRGQLLLWDVISRVSDDAESLAQLAEVVSGYRLDKGGNVVPVSGLRDRLSKLRAKARDGSFISWFLANRCKRAISPLSPITVQQYLTRLTEQEDTYLASYCSQ